MEPIDPELVKSQPCAEAFGRMFWAFLFFFDFRLGVNEVRVDVLPDVVGWCLFAVALAKISEVSPAVVSLRWFALWLLVWSIFDVVQFRGASDIEELNAVFLILGIIAGVLNVVFVWKLCGLIIEMASAVGDTVVRRNADARRKIYLGFHIFLLVSIGLAAAAPPFALVAVIVGIPLAIVILCLMMGLMKQTERMCLA